MTTYDVAVIGGTGPQGKGLAYRWARHGHRVVLGSRSPERAQEAAAEITARAPDASVSGSANTDAAAGADVVVLAVPYDGHDDLVASLADQLDGKVVISCVNPLGFDKQGPYGIDVPGGSAAETAAALVPSARLVGAFCGVRRSTSTTRTSWSAATTPTPRPSRSSSPVRSPPATAWMPGGSGSLASSSPGPPC